MTVTLEDREKLRDAAIAATNATRTHSVGRRAALAGDWKLQTSNSFRRIGVWGDGDVLCGTTHLIDGHPDLLSRSGVLEYIVEAQPRVVLALLDDLDAAEDKLEKARIICGKFEGIDARLDAAAQALAAIGSVVDKLATCNIDVAVIVELRGVVEKFVGFIAVPLAQEKV